MYVLNKVRKKYDELTQDTFVSAIFKYSKMYTF
jgi:hypothetical protein